MDKPIGELTLQERADLMEAFISTIENAADKLRAVDASDFPELEQLAAVGQENIGKALTTVTDAVAFLRSVFEKSENYESNTSTGSSEVHRRAKKNDPDKNRDQQWQQWQYPHQHFCNLVTGNLATFFQIILFAFG
jgi:hypothetical protein